MAADQAVDEVDGVSNRTDSQQQSRPQQCTVPLCPPILPALSPPLREASLTTCNTLALRELDCHTLPESPSPSPSPPATLRHVAPSAPHSTPVGGRLRHHLAAWRRIGASPWVLNTIKYGLTLDFIEAPHQLNWPPEAPPQAHKETLESELLANIAKGAVEPVPPPRPGQAVFYSSQFTVPKKDPGKYRQVSNLRPLNQFLSPVPFKMETLATLKSVIRRHDYMTSIDIQDAFFHIPLAAHQQDLYRFRWAGQHYRFVAMPFGLALAPRTFTKILRPVVGHLRSRGVRLLIYLDDILLLAESADQAISQTQLMVDLLSDLGFSINFPKSQLTPQRTAEYLGFKINSVDLTLWLPPKKIDSLTAALRRARNRALRGDPFSPRELAALVGALQASHPAMELAPLYLRQLRHSYLVASLQDWDQATVFLPRPALDEVNEWLTHLNHWNGRQLLPPTPSILLTSDASRSGWGAWVSLPASPDVPVDSTWGFWSAQERLRTSNWREATATCLGIKTFQSILRGHKCLLVRSDNTANVSAINRHGSSVLTLAAIARESHLLCRQLGLTLTAVHVPGIANDLADELSRVTVDPSDWMLHPSLFEAVTHHWYLPTVDLFATRVNCQVPRFFSFRPDPAALAVDAFHQPWASELPYANPPPALIPRILAKVQLEELDQFILVAPLWRTQHWWPILLRMICDWPLQLPRGSGTYTPGHKASNEAGGPNSWETAVFLLSGQPSRIAAFRKQLGTHPQPPCAPPPLQPMTDIGPILSSL